MIESVEIKAATPEKMKDIKRIFSYYFLDSENIDHKDIVMALSGEKVLGCACMSGSELRLIAVHPSYRGRGIGTELVKHLISRSRALNRAIYLRTTAPGFFEKLGFVPVGDSEKKSLWEDCSACDRFDVCTQTAMRRSFFQQP